MNGNSSVALSTGANDQSIAFITMNGIENTKPPIYDFVPISK